MAHRDLPVQIIDLLGAGGDTGLSADDLVAAARVSRPTVNRALKHLVDAGQLARSGAPGTAWPPRRPTVRLKRVHPRSTRPGFGSAPQPMRCWPNCAPR